jgi:hypothetical protein
MVVLWFLGQLQYTFVIHVFSDGSAVISTKSRSRKAEKGNVAMESRHDVVKRRYLTVPWIQATLPEKSSATRQQMLPETNTRFL